MINLESFKKKWLAKIILIFAVLGILVNLAYLFSSRKADISLAPPETQANGESDEDALVPFGITNPFQFEDYNFDYLDKNKGPLDQNETRQYMKDLADIGINVISQHFHRKKYDNDGSPHFKIQKQQIKTYLIEPQTYLEGGKNPFYFWAAISTDTNKCFAGDIVVEVKNGNDEGLLHQIIANEAQLKKVKTCAPYSEAGFGEFNNWLSLAINLFSDPEVAGAGQNLTDRLAYIQIGNEPDGDYKKPKSSICPDPANADCYYHGAYAKLIERVYDTIKNKVPKAKIVIGTLAGGAVSVDGFQKPTLEYLFNGGNKKCDGTGCFDLFDYHAFGEFTDYNNRVVSEKGVTLNKNFDYFRGVLNEIGFSDKGLVIQQAATHTGSEPKEESWGSKYQTEEDQASFLVKRMVYNVNKGMEQSQYGPLIEHYCYKDTIHNRFTLGSLLYNGIPGRDGVPWCQEENPLPKNYNITNCDGQLPCPDPGENVKKLSYFSYKKLIETLKGSDWQKTEPMMEPPDPNNPENQAAFVYKFTKKDSSLKPVYIAWWDWWKGCPRDNTAVNECKNNNLNDYAAMDSCVNAINATCVATGQPTITIAVGNNVREVKITEAIPDYTTGQEADNVSYENVFKSYTVSVIDGKAKILLEKKPVYAEENLFVPSPTIINPHNGDFVAPGSKMTIIVDSDGLENIKDVKFFINNEAHVGGKNKEGLYYYNWKTPYGFDRKYAIYAQVLDKQRNVLASAEPVEIYSSAPPAVSIMNPKDNDSFSPRQKITLQSKLSPTNDGIAKIEFQIKDASKNIIKKCPSYQSDRQGIYSCFWQAPKKPGQTYFIQAVSYAKQSFYTRQIPAGYSKEIMVSVE